MLALVKLGGHNEKSINASIRSSVEESTANLHYALRTMHGDCRNCRILLFIHLVTRQKDSRRIDYLPCSYEVFGSAVSIVNMERSMLNSEAIEECGRRKEEKQRDASEAPSASRDEISPMARLAALV